jgi:outer membrane protein
MKKHLLAAVAVAACASGAVYAQDFKAGDMLVRARAVGLYSDNDTSPAKPLTVNDKAIPEVDFSYFFSKNLAAELILTIPQEHNVRLGGAKIGTLKHLPPTLTLQYHFDLGGFKPYVGAGVNFTQFSDVKLVAPLTADKTSTGFALQAGVDIPLSKTMFLNIDVKKVQIGTEIKSGGTKVTDFKVDPVLFGIGLGWKF